MSKFTDYALFGLRLRSAVPLPELPTSDSDGEPDLIIEYGDVRGERNGDEPQAIPGGAMLVIDGVARYAVIDGGRIVVEPAPGAAERNVRLYLLGSAMGMLLHQRSLLPLHANGVEIDGKAVLFMGASGAGKSTLASWFVRNGYRLVADDVCAIATANRRPLVLPGIPRFRLWEDAIAGQGLSLEGLSLSYAGDASYRKFDVPVAPGNRVSDGLTLGGIYVLHQSAETRMVPLAGLDAIQELYAHTYRGEYVARLALRERHMQICTRLANEVPIFAAHRSWGLSNMDRENAILLDHVLKTMSRQDAAT